MNLLVNPVHPHISIGGGRFLTLPIDQRWEGCTPPDDLGFEKDVFFFLDRKGSNFLAGGVKTEAQKAGVSYQRPLAQVSSFLGSLTLVG